MGQGQAVGERGEVMSKPIESRLICDEVVMNTERKFGAGDRYFPVWVMHFDGQWGPALFSDKQILAAMERAEANPEDIPPRKKRSLLDRLLGR